jgi:hypothetical protein
VLPPPILDQAKTPRWTRTAFGAILLATRGGPMPFEEAEFLTEAETVEAEEQAEASGTSDPSNARKTVEVISLIIIVIVAIWLFAFLTIQ